MFSHRLRVRYSECDQQGVVFNAHYLSYYDVALTELWREKVCRYQDMTEKGDDMVVAETRLRFLRPVRFDEDLDITLNLQHIGTTSLIIRSEYHVGGTLVFEGEVRHVFVDGATMTKKPVPDYVRNGLTPPETRLSGAGA
jgi:acyl-CoA thioester hydrolase